MKQLCTEIEIKAPAERVWKILTEFSKYPDWNPFIRKVEGLLNVGAKLKVHLEPTNARGFTFRPRVMKVEPNREICWLGRFFAPGLFDGEHSFKVEPITAGKVRFVQRETYNGLLVPLLTHTLDTDILRGFKEMNQALKKRAEQ